MSHLDAPAERMVSSELPLAMPASRQTLFLSLASLVVAIAFLILIATVVAIAVWIVTAAFTTVPEPSRTWPRLTAWAVVAIPVVALLLAFLLNRGSDERTFYAQREANKRVSLLLLVVLVGLFVVIGEIIAVTLTFDSYWVLAGAALAGLIGAGAALFAQTNGSSTVLASTGARPIDPASTIRSPELTRLADVVREISIAADLESPALYLIEDPAPNAMAVGTNSGNAAIAVTTGLLHKLDREELQGVVAHELSHIRNLDSRYGVYVAILVGLVALVTDGFLRIVVEGWRQGAFVKGAVLGDDSRGAALISGLALGLLLLAVSLVLRLFAPIAALLVQACVNRQREFLADATSVEITRNPVGLQRALTSLRNDNRVIKRTNRGNQHLWLVSPLDKDADGPWHLFATHPTLDARIARLNQLYPEKSGRLQRAQA